MFVCWRQIVWPPLPMCSTACATGYYTHFLAYCLGQELDEETRNSDPEVLEQRQALAAALQ